jgi:hypothetical protein
MLFAHPSKEKLAFLLSFGTGATTCGVVGILIAEPPLIIRGCWRRSVTAQQARFFQDPPGRQAD